jgi:hypothetical protein
MPSITIKQLHYDLTPTAGLSLIGHYLDLLEPELKRIDAAVPVRRGGVSTSDVLRSCLGLLAQGKSDFDAIEKVREDEFFRRALGIAQLPSSPTLRQRLDAQAEQSFDAVPEMIEALLAAACPDLGLLPCGWLPLDVDTFAMDNGGTRKDGVGRTYAGVDGFCPLAAYLGSAGLWLTLALRPGTQQSACETEFNFEDVVPMAHRLSQAAAKVPLPPRLDSGFDSAKLARSIESYTGEDRPLVHWLVKWNPRTTNVQAQAAALQSKKGVRWQHPRSGKRVALWVLRVQIEGVERPLRRVLRLTEHTIDARGPQLLVPELTLEGWTTSLPARIKAQQVIDLYADHGTHEQFHSAFKTDLDIERLPSGKFNTDYLVCGLAALAMNILRLLAQAGLHGADSPVRHEAKRRRLKTAMQELIYRAGRLIRTARGMILGLGANDRAAFAFIRLNAALANSSG